MGLQLLDKPPKGTGYGGRCAGRAPLPLATVHAALWKAHPAVWLSSTKCRGSSVAPWPLSVCWVLASARCGEAKPGPELLSGRLRSSWGKSLTGAAW